ncbi:MAG: dTDP-4-dehydrorhamnose reductase [Candidatus Omnitrophota bacterium]
MNLNIDNSRFLITGSAGQLGKAFQDILSKKGVTIFAPAEGEFDITSGENIGAVIEKTKPDVLINCAAYNAVDKAEDEPDRAFAVNAAAAGNLAGICKEKNIFFVHYSSDYVFDGLKKTPYSEADKPHPLNIYGASKLEGERQVQLAGGKYLIFRLSWVFGEGRQNFLYKLREWVKGKTEISIASDEVSAPTYTYDVVDMTLKALAADLKGLYHLVNSGMASRYELAKHFFSKAGIDIQVHAVKAENFRTKTNRPYFTAMSNKKLEAALGVKIPEWEDAVLRFLGMEKEKS